jgi:hypothetical protein
VLDENGQELYSIGTPANMKRKYTPTDIVQVYKYRELDTEATIFVGQKEDTAYSYLIGMIDYNVKRYVLDFDNRDLVSFLKNGGLVLLIDVLIALCMP